MDRPRAIPDWTGTLNGLTETLEDVMFTIRMGREVGVQDDYIVLEAFDQLDRYISMVKLDLGV